MDRYWKVKCSTRLMLLLWKSEDTKEVIRNHKSIRKTDNTMAKRKSTNSQMYDDKHYNKISPFQSVTVLITAVDWLHHKHINLSVNKWPSSVSILYFDRHWGRSFVDWNFCQYIFCNIFIGIVAQSSRLL
jgi:hypothetical protein